MSRDPVERILKPKPAFVSIWLFVPAAATLLVLFSLYFCISRLKNYRMSPDLPLLLDDLHFFGHVRDETWQKAFEKVLVPREERPSTFSRLKLLARVLLDLQDPLEDELLTSGSSSTYVTTRVALNDESSAGCRASKRLIKFEHPVEFKLL
ncbi:hypothetical protein BC567DRAFT_268188 [Phyllosticta citribraziliensis]